MAATYLQRYAFITSEDLFEIRVMMASIDVAIQVNDEASSGDSAVDQARVSFARSVLHQPNRFSRLIANGVVVHADAKANMTDVELKAIVADIWNAYAGVKPAS